MMPSVLKSAQILKVYSTLKPVVVKKTKKKHKKTTKQSKAKQQNQTQQNKSKAKQNKMQTNKKTMLSFFIIVISLYSAYIKLVILV